VVAKNNKNILCNFREKQEIRMVAFSFPMCQLLRYFDCGESCGGKFKQQRNCFCLLFATTMPAEKLKS
jgi:hypothetical protein